MDRILFLSGRWINVGRLVPTCYAFSTDAFSARGRWNCARARPG